MASTDFAFVTFEDIKSEDSNDNATVIFNVKMSNLGVVNTQFNVTANFVVSGGLAAMNAAIAAAVRAVYSSTFNGAVLGANRVAMQQFMLG
jgi:hypothetical protein